jgi:2,4-dienoyl-CoA reductase-like NADH-dependent reductase (Old Yellow Enzyme family)
MSALFETVQIGGMTVQNRFVRSATHEAMARETGEVTDSMIAMYRNLAKADIGLIITGFAYVHPRGRCMKHQTGIHSDAMVSGLRKLVDAVHEQGSKVAIETVHAGLQTNRALIGGTPLGPSGGLRNPVTLTRSKEMSDEEIWEAVRAFAEAARRADEAGADAVHLDAAGGYLLNQFLSPYFNRRTDSWGGSDENRFRFLKEVVVESRKVLSKATALLVKINADDRVGEEGIRPEMAARHASWLAELGIDGLELGSGTMHYSMMHAVRGRVPVEEMVQNLPFWQRPIVRRMLAKQVGQYGFKHPWNLEMARSIRPHLGQVPLILVGGLRRLEEMEQLVADGDADLVAMCRPFIREPDLVRKFRRGETKEAACLSCNRCFAAVVATIPIDCYVGGLPRKG